MTLLESADEFHVPAAHVLYCGDPEYRSTLDCGYAHHDRPCRERERAGVSILASIAVQNLIRLSDTATAGEAFHHSVPLEDIALPSGPDGTDLPTVSPISRTLPDDLRRFLGEPQTGPRLAAKTLLRPVQHMRDLQFSSMLADGRVDGREDVIFQDVPEDYGHFSVPYLSHILRGLRRDMPDYVQDVLAGREPPALGD